MQKHVKKLAFMHSEHQAEKLASPYADAVRKNNKAIMKTHNSTTRDKDQRAYFGTIKRQWGLQSPI
jgi:hypothetical protein